MWDAKTGDKIGLPFIGHSDCITSVNFSPDGTSKVTGSEDTLLMIWDA